MTNVPLSIALVAPLVAPLGAPRPYGNHHFVCDLARGLAGRGHDVTVYAARGSCVDGVRVEDVDVPDAAKQRFLVLREHDECESKAMAEAFEDLFRRLRTRAHDVISQHAFDAEAITASEGLPALHTLHLPPLSSAVVAALRSTHNPLCAVSRAAGERWADVIGRPLTIIPNGVPNFRPPACAIDNIAVVAGRISREKGVATAVRIARRAKLRPLVIGEIYDRDYFEREVALELDVSEIVPTLARDALARVLARAAVLLMPIEWDEPFGLIAAEALRAGCPVVAYRRGALPEVVDHGIDGFLLARAMSKGWSPP